MEMLLSNGSRKLLILFIQIFIIVTSFLLAFCLRFDLNIPPAFLRTALWLMPILILVKLATFWWMNLFSGWWRYISLPDLLVVLRANALASATLYPIAEIAHRTVGFPRSVLIIDALLCFLFMGGVRVSARMLREQLELRRKGGRNGQAVLIVGAGAVGQTFVREIRQNPNLNMTILGFVDDDPERQKLRFQGVPVLGTTRELPRIIERQEAGLVIIAQPAVDAQTLQKIVETCRRGGVQSKILPAVSTIMNGDISVRQLRDVQVDDLLGRPPVLLDVGQIREYLKGKRILVTGAGGSIGSEICRQVASFAPESLLLLDHAETPLFNIENELRERFPGQVLQPCLADVRDRCGIRALFAAQWPEVVFHAAAYKHVPMSECNPIEAVRNNVFGTRIVADTADEFGVKKFVMVSTDKAVNPANAMGASKRAAEIYVQCLSRRSSTHLVTVRFGNVLGSNGSVVPIFRRQIEQGGPVTVTHPEVTRFFMTIPEAVQLVLQAGSMGQGGEIFLLEMGEPIKILRLAEEIIRLSGLRVHQDIEIVFTGLRPGEKLHEELLLPAEGMMPTRHAKIKIAHSTPYDAEMLLEQMERLYLATRQMDRHRVLGALAEIVPEYRSGHSGSAASRPSLAFPAPKIRQLKPLRP